MREETRATRLAWDLTTWNPQSTAELNNRAFYLAAKLLRWPQPLKKV
jgi:hypothetical protein